MERTRRKIGQVFYFTKLEKDVLRAIARRQQISQSELVRTLIRDEAKRIDLWPQGGVKC